MKMFLFNRKQKVKRWLVDKDFIEAKMTEQINAAAKLVFSVPLKKRLPATYFFAAIPQPRGSGYLLFKIVTEQVQSDRVQYTCIEAAYDELKSYHYIKDDRPQNRSAADMLQMALDGTRWSVGTAYDTGTGSTNFYYISSLEAIQKIADLFQLEVVFSISLDPNSHQITRRLVNLYAQQGERTGKRFEYGSNLLSVEREESSENLITALIGRGKGEEKYHTADGKTADEDQTPDGYGRRINFADVVWSTDNGNPVNKPAGQEYVEDPDATAAYGFDDGKPRIGIEIFEDITDPGELLQATWSALQTLKRPKVSFKANTLDVGDLGLGDTVAIIRHDIKIEYFTRVYKVEHNLLNEKQNTIELGDDFNSQSITSAINSIASAVKQTNQTANYASVSANGKNTNNYGKDRPSNAVEGDLWYKDLGNGEVDLYQYHDGNWILITSTRDLHNVQKQVEKAQSELDTAKNDIIANKQKADTDIENLNKSIEENKKVADAGIDRLNQSIEANKKTADESLQKLNDSVANLQGQYDNNIVPDLNKAAADAADALQKYIEAQNSITDLTKQAQQQGKDIADVTSTVNGLNINYANLAGDVSSTKADVKGLQTTIGAANGDIAQLKLDAQNLQAMLAGKVDDSVYQNFVTLTNQALAAKLTASDLAGYAKTVDVQATANGLQLNIDSVNGRLDNLQIGTNNLLHHSDTFAGWNKGTSVTISTDKYLNGVVVVLGNTGEGGNSLSGSLDGPYDDQPVTWTIWAKADNAGDKLHTELFGGGGFTDQPLTTEWKRYKFSGHRDPRQHRLFFWGPQSNTGDIYIALPYAVVGNEIGTWLPNSGDIHSNLAQLSARITANSQQFSSYYTKSETDSKANAAKTDAVNTIKNDANWTGLTNIITNSGFLQTADGFTQKVQQTAQPLIDANNGGGINLLKKTNFANETIAGLQKVWGQQFTLRDGKAMQLDALNISKGVADAVQLVPVDPDTDYTLSFEALFNTVATGGNWNAIQTFMVERKNATENTATYVDHARTIVNTDKRKDNIYTIHTQKDCHYLQVIFRANAKTLISFTRPKLEKGRVSTPYSPAPSDNVTQLAFTELTQTVNGLQSTVSNNYTGLQTQINQTATAIRSELTDSTSGLQNQITATANGLDLTIKNLVVGGGNLLHNSDTFDGWSINGTVKIDDSMYLNGKIAVLTPGNGTSNELLASSFDGPLTDETATWVIYAKADNAGDKLHTELFGGGGLTNQSLTTEWQKYKFTGHRDKRLKQLHFWGLAENQGNIYIALPILSEGSVEKTWEPNPADMATRKDFASLNVTLQGLQSTVSSNYGTLQSQISQTASAIRSELADQVTGVTNQITTTANGLNARIGSLTIGGENLLHNSDTFERWGKGTSVAISSDNYLNGAVAVLSPGGSGGNSLTSDADKVASDTSLTWTVYAKADNAGDKLHTELWGGGGITDQTLTTEWKKYKFSGKQNQNNRGFYLWGCQGNAGNVYVALPMLYSGSIDRDWSANSADMATKADFTEVNATINGLQSTVGSNYSSLQSQLNQTATTIRGEVTNSVNGLQTQITQQADNFNVSLNALRNETAWQKVTTAIDANNYTTTGNYWIQAAPNSNTPDGSAWAYLQVVAYPDVKRIKQTWQRDNNANEAYTRLKTGNDWSDWQKTVTAGNIMAQINMSAGTTLIQNNKIYMDADSTIFSGKAFIPSAAITDLSADKITTGTLNAGNVNIININADNITAGTIKGTNLSIGLNSGEVEFQHGRIHNFDNTVDINLDQAYISTANNNILGATRALLKDGELQLTQPNIFDTNGDWYFRLFNGGGSGDAFAGGSLVGKNNVTVANKDNYQGATGLSASPVGEASFAGLFVGKGNSWMPTLLEGAERGVFIKGGKSISSEFMHGGPLMPGSPYISVGSDSSGANFWDNRIVIDGEYVHIPSTERHTTGESPNVYVAPDGALLRSTSASKYKTMIERSHSLDYGERLLSLPTATWIDKAESRRYASGESDMKPVTHFGMIAEDLAAAGLEMLVSRGQDGELEGIQYDRIAPALLPVIKKLQDRIKKLEERLNG